MPVLRVLSICLPLVSCKPPADAVAPALEAPTDPPAAEGPASPPAGYAPGRAATGEPALPPRYPATGILVSATAAEPDAPLPLDPAGETVVHPGASYELVLAVRVADARLVLVDARDTHIPARGTIETGRRTTLVLAPASPLVPGSSYVLRLEGAVGRALHDAAGRAYEPLSFSLLAAGTPPPPDPPRRSRRRRR